MELRRLPARLAASLVVLSLALAGSPGKACSLMPIIEMGFEGMPAQCRKALSNPRKFLARVKAGKIERQALNNLVRAFDDGKYGCRENKAFVFQTLDTFYSVSERKLSEPWLLQRYAFNFPEGVDPAKRDEIFGLLWLFTESWSYLPPTWTKSDARAVVERPEYWPIALAKFGRMRDRDDAVFASLVDPQSTHFDRQRALKLLEFPSKHLAERKLLVAELFADPRFGTPDFALVERLLPVSSLYPAEQDTATRQQARVLWNRVMAAYGQSGDPALQDKAEDLRPKMAPVTLNGWSAMAAPRDGRVWLSPAEWPKGVRNPFSATLVTANLLNENDYPVRALREARTGRVTLAVHFGADGKYASLDVVGSSGHPDLDDTAATTIARRLRSKLSALAVDGFQGREVMVPLLVVNWDISEETADDGDMDGSYLTNGVLSIVAKSRFYDLSQGNTCGYIPSVFI